MTAFARKAKIKAWKWSMISELDLLVLQGSPWRVICRGCQVTMCPFPTSQKQWWGEGRQGDPLGQGLNNQSYSGCYFKSRTLWLGENSFLISLRTIWVNATHPFHWERDVSFGHQVLSHLWNAVILVRTEHLGCPLWESSLGMHYTCSRFHLILTRTLCNELHYHHPHFTKVKTVQK